MKVAFTIATANYLAQAKAVADSFIQHNQGYEFTIFVLDKIKHRIDTSSFGQVKLIEIEELKIECFQEMLEQYSIFELSNALKPFVAYHLIAERKVDHLFYFDSDILIYNSVIGVECLLHEKDIIISPHFCSPLPLDGLILEEKDFLNAGIYNGGFFAIKNSQESVEFLKWWMERMRKFCFINFTKGLFVDQIWLNFVPLYFKNVHVVKDLGYNVAYWNLHERSIKRISGEYFINECFPLVFFHYSGYDIDNPSILSKHQSRYSIEDRPDVLPLLDTYSQMVRKNKHEWFSKLSCFYIDEKLKISKESLSTKDKTDTRRKFLESVKWLLRKYLRIEVSLVKSK